VNSSARLRGKHFEALEAMVRDPKIDAHIRGKTLKDLGIEQIVDLEEQARRKTQALVVEDENSVNMKFFTVYDEFDTSELNTLGETAGSRGMIYNETAKDAGLLEDHVEGALQGSCSLVSSDGKQMCSYEFFFMNSVTGALCTVVATGTVKNELDMNSVLIVESTGDDFIQYDGGMAVIKYTAIGEQTVMDLQLVLHK